MLPLQSRCQTETLLCSDLGLEYLDLYLIHFPVRIRPGASFEKLKEEDFLELDLKGVWLELEKLKERGLIKSIGVSNFSVKRLQEMFALTNCIPSVNQVRLTLWVDS